MGLKTRNGDVFVIPTGYGTYGIGQVIKRRVDINSATSNSAFSAWQVVFNGVYNLENLREMDLRSLDQIPVIWFDVVDLMSLVDKRYERLGNRKPIDIEVPLWASERNDVSTNGERYAQLRDFQNRYWREVPLKSVPQATQAASEHTDNSSSLRNALNKRYYTPNIMGPETKERKSFFPFSSFTEKDLVENWDKYQIMEWITKKYGVEKPIEPPRLIEWEPTKTQLIEAKKLENIPVKIAPQSLLAPL